jgi:type I restriction enzyme S subunit
MNNMNYVKAKDLVTFKTGKLDSNAAEEGGLYPFFTCSQTTYQINSFAFDTECVLLAGNNAGAIFPLKYYNGKFNAYQRASRKTHSHGIIMINPTSKYYQP